MGRGEGERLLTGRERREATSEEVRPRTLLAVSKADFERAREDIESVITRLGELDHEDVADQLLDAMDSVFSMADKEMAARNELIFEALKELETLSQDLQGESGERARKVAKKLAGVEETGLERDYDELKRVLDQAAKAITHASAGEDNLMMDEALADIQEYRRSL